MSSGWILFGVATFICLGVFLNGVRFARMTSNPFAGKRIGPFPVEGSEMSVSSIRLIGRLQMIAAPTFWLIFSALAFGLLGPVEGIQTITF